MRKQSEQMLQNNPYDINRSRIYDNQGFSEQIFSTTEPFQLKDFEIPGFPENEKIKFFSISQQAFVMITISDRIIRWKFDIQSKSQEYFLPKDSLIKNVGKMGNSIFTRLTFTEQKQKDIIENQILEKVFQDQKGDHCILFDSFHKYYYFNINQENIKRIDFLNGYKIKSLCFDSRKSFQTSIHFIAGTMDGEIYLGFIQLKNDEINVIQFKLIKQLGQKSIYHLKFLTFEQANKETHYLIIAASNSGFYYFFQTSPSTTNLEIQDLNTDNEDNYFQIPLEYSHSSLLDVSYAKENGRPLSFIYTNCKNLIYIKFPNPHQPLNKLSLSKFESLNCQKQGVKDSEQIEYRLKDTPQDILLTEYHYCIQYSQSLTIYSLITQKNVRHYDLKFMGNIQQLLHENLDSFYIISDLEIRKIDFEYENKNVWRYYQEVNNLQQSYEMCRLIKSGETEYIAGLYADDLFNKGKYEDAVKVYAQSNKSFEEIFLKLNSSDKYEARLALEYYLTQLLSFYSKDENAHMERQILIACLIELDVYFVKYFRNNLLQLKLKAEIDAENDQNQENKSIPIESCAIQDAEFKVLQAQSKLEHLLQKCKNFIDDDLVFQILQPHGMIDECIDFAQQRKQFEMIVLHNINEGNFKQALTFISELDYKKGKDLMYKYCHLFFTEEPEITTNILINKIIKFEPTKILGSLYNIPTEKQEVAIQILNYCIIQLKSDEKSIHNSFIYFLAKNNKTEQIDSYLKKQKEKFLTKFKVSFEFEFALKICNQFNQYSAMVIIYGLMGHKQEAVALALEQNMLEIAKKFAEEKNSGDINQQKKLYMQIVNHLIFDKQNMQEIVNLIKQSNKILKIDEIIPLFEPDLKIDSFQQNMCEQLQHYNQEINDLKEVMDNLSKKSEEYQRELIQMRNNYYQFDSHKKCDLCQFNLINQNDEYYLFPCLHGFHSKCIVNFLNEFDDIMQDKLFEISLLQRQMDAIKDERGKSIDELQKNEESIFSKFFSNIAEKQPSIFIETKKVLQKKTLSEEMKMFKDKYDKTLASECLKCCSTTVETIDIQYKGSQDWKI